MKKILGMGNALVDIMTTLPDDGVLAEFNQPKGSDIVYFCLTHCLFIYCGYLGKTKRQ